ncbi:hypothetical protein Tco_0847875, partial [Tanacetum coccineum]
MITEEMKHTEHYRMYVEMFGLDIPLTQSQPTKSTQGTHRTPSAPRSPTHKKNIAESIAPKRYTVIRFRLPERRSTRLTPPVPVPTIEKADKMILQDTLQVSLVEHKNREEQEARENVELVNKHLASKEIEKLVEGSENVIDDSSPPRNDEPQIPNTRLEPQSDKESPKVKRTNDEEVEVTYVIILVNVNEEEDEITNEVYELKRREKGKIVEESRSTPLPTPIRSPRTHTNLVSSDTEKLQELTETHTQTTSSSRSQHTKLSRVNQLLSLFKAKSARKSFDTLADHLQEIMVESLPTMVDTYIKEQVKKQVPEQVRDQVPVAGIYKLKFHHKFKKAIDNQIPSQVDVSVRSYMSGHILHVHPAQTQTLSILEQQYQLYLSIKDNLQLQQQDIVIRLALQMKFENLQVQQTTCRPSAVRPRDQDDPRDDSHPEGENSAKRQKTSEYEAYVSGESSSGKVNEEERDDVEIPSKQVSQDIMEEVSLTIDEAKLKKMADEMLRQRCTSGDEHQYHIDQMKNFLQNPEAQALSLINQDLLYLNKGSSGPEKIVLSLHKFPAIIFKDDDIEERTSRRVNKCVNKFNPYARYGVEHWKNPHAKIFYIRKQKEPGKPKEEVYSNSKIIQVIKTYWKLGHEYKFVIEIVTRRANECIVLIIEPDYKNLNKNDIEDVYLLIMNGKVPDYAETELLWSFINIHQKFRVEKHGMFSIIYEPVHGIIYKNSKNEKRVMRHSEIHKFCDATLNRVLEGLKSYNNDVKYAYVQRELTNDEVEYLKLFKEEIEFRLKHNRNSFKPAAQTTTNAEGTSTTLIPGPVTADENIQKKNDVKSRSFRRLNKPDLDTMSFDDLYNNFKIVEQEVKGTASSSSSLSSQNVAFVSSSSSTNEVNTAYGVSTANTQVSPASTQVRTASTQVSTANLNDLEEMDLKWQLALLSMRTRKFFQKTGRKITINGSDTAGYDKSKVECFNYHKLRHFARECRGPMNQDNKSRNQDSSRRTINVEETSSKAMLAIDGAGFDWSYMADDEVPTNMALIAFSDSKAHNVKTSTYKRGLASIEEQLVFYKKNEVLFCEQLAVLKRDISYKDSKISMLKSELEKLKQEKESNQLKIERFDNASKSLDKLIESQITDKSIKGMGLSLKDMDLTSKSVSEDTSNEVKESPDASLVEELVSNDKLEKK